jgi:hypothetical protein
MTQPRPPFPDGPMSKKLPTPPRPATRPRPRIRLAYIAPTHSRLDPAGGSRPRFDDDGIVRSMRKYGIPITRENYIAYAYGDWADEWCPEFEADLPEELQCIRDSQG